MNTVEKEKQEGTTQDIPDLKDGKQTNPELENLNLQITELKDKNTDLLVSI